MATIVMVHGAFNELWGPNELHHRWLPALRDGLWHVGAEVAADDVDVCFYGDLFRRDPESPDQPDDATRAGVADMLQETLGDDGLTALEQAAGRATFDRTVDLVVTMTTQADLRDRVQARVRDVVGPDTRILVAHSLGTIVSYRALCQNPDWAIDTFVTLGSPLGAPMLADQILEKGDDGLAAWPGSAQHWVTWPRWATTPARSPVSPRCSARGWWTASWTMATGPTTPSPTSTTRRPARRWPRRWPGCAPAPEQGPDSEGTPRASPAGSGPAGRRWVGTQPPPIDPIASPGRTP